MLSGNLAQILAKQTSISLVAARKRISRLASPVYKTSLGFENNQSLVFLENQFDTESYWKNLDKSLKESSRAYYAFIKAMVYHFGYLKKSQIAAYTFSPVQNLKGHLHSADVIGKLISNDIIVQFDTEIFKINSKMFEHHNLQRFRAIELAKKQVIDDFKTWARNINLTSYGAARSLNPTAEFAKFQWCFTAPSYTSGLVEFKNQTIKPGFIVADILIGRKITKDDIDFFIKKIAIIKQQKNYSTFLPFLICDNLADSAFHAAKSSGLIIGFVKELFGASYAETIQLLIKTVTEITKVITKNPDQLLELIRKLTKLEGRFGNLKGDVFEFAVGYFYAMKNFPIEIGKIIRERESGENKEIDVFVNSQDQIRVVECKGRRSQMKKIDVEDWINRKIPIIRKWILAQDDYRRKDIIFEMWSTSGFEKDAQSFLKRSSESVRPLAYKIVFFDGITIRRKVKKTQNAKLIEVMNHYFYET